ncbi:DUF6320 domain-containing protein [Eubacteriales bacterium OttesenSCG-928-K08]|nr:DUF6320 domain-containing protein [Eubacteriales bacterium OttesenSCG-928-K08]
MAYCVNCGVELEKSLKQCPLCGVEAINPREPYDALAPRPYSAHIDSLQRRAGRRLVGWIVTVLMILGGVICVMANLVYNETLTWSIYVLASLMLVWVLIMLPLLYRLHPVVAVLLDIGAMMLFLYLFNLADTSTDWYFDLAVPMVLICGVLALIDVAAFLSPKIVGWQQYGIVLMSLGIAMMGLEALLDLFNDMEVHLGWSWFTVLPTFALGLVFFILERRRELKDAIYKRLRL